MSPDKDTQRLFVEGPSDAAVINKLVLIRLKVDLAQPPSHRIIEAPAGDGGFDAALQRFTNALGAKKPNRLGLLVDRDGLDGKPDRWGAVSAALSDAGLDPPLLPSPDGVRIEAPWGSRVGVWLMPDNISSGDIETFLEGLLPNPVPATWDYALEAVNRAKALGATYRDVHRPKARFHSWLAWQDPPGVPYGRAIEAKLLGAASPAADAFVLWFVWLFGR
ncbi:MAG: hypothetical protein IPG45_26330 [Deltaproteobacteria bacterium]|nr:hypothetical protein [Deltaproteobacteria bacterium]